MQYNRNNAIVWGFFSVVFIGSYVLFLQRFSNPSLLSAIIALSLTFTLDKLLQKRQNKKEKQKVTKDNPKFMRNKGKSPKKRA